ncbi:MAG: PAS domain S-box protein [Myxococcota bacterium]
MSTPSDQDDEEALLRSAALQNVQAVLLTRHRAEAELMATKEALRDSTERLTIALAAGHLGYWGWDRVGHTLTLSPEAAEILGRPGQLFLARAELHGIVHADDRDAVRQALEHALEAHDDYDIEYRVRLPDGGVSWVAAKGRGIYDADGAGAGMIGVLQDLTERKRVDEALRESESRLRATFSQAAVGFAVATLDGRLQEINHKLCDILGYQEDELRTKTLMDITHPADRTLTQVRMGSLLNGEVSDVRFEQRYVCRDGATVWSLTTVTVLQDAEGRPDRLVTVVEEISQRKQAEEALREESRVLEVLNRTGAAIASELDLMALLQTVTDAATELTGARFGAFFYNVVAPDGEALQLFTLSGAPRSAFDHFGLPRNTPVFSPTFRNEGVVRVDDIQLDPRYGKMGPHFGMPPGHPPVRSYLAVSVVTRSKEVIGGLFFGHPDPGMFTERAERLVLGVAAQAATAIDNARLYEAARTAAEERKRLLEAEQVARAHAERMSELKDQFLATLSHELRTPLGAILGWAQVIRKRKMSEPELQRALEVVERNARAQARLIEDLLDMARITSGQVALDVQPVDPHGFIEAALETVRPAAEGKGIRIQKALDPAAGALAGDANRLQQVVWNLLSNAIKFTPPDGEIHVTLLRHGQYLELRVADTGMGIQPDFLPYVFDRFRQADGSSTRRHGGLGLGLAIAKHLVELHGGSLTAESAGVGQGASFIVQLPVVRGQGGTLPPVLVGSAPSEPAPLPYEMPDLSGLKILAVDDEADARDLIQRVLEDCGAHVIVAASAAEALALVEQERPDLLLSDIGMPDVDGYELLRLVRELGPERGGAVPAIAVTAFARSKDRTRVLRAGFRFHLAKPLEPAELIVTVASVLGRQT